MDDMEVEGSWSNKKIIIHSQILGLSQFQTQCSTD